MKMRLYEGCFTGHEAVEWLLVYIQARGLFGEVSRPQVERLMQKFLQSDVIEGVRGKEATRRFDENHFYQFVTEPGPFNFVEASSSPLRKRKSDYSGTCFTNEYAFMRCEEDSATSANAKRACSSAAIKLAVFDVNSQSTKLPPSVIAGVWKEFTLAR